MAKSSGFNRRQMLGENSFGLAALGGLAAPSPVVASPGSVANPPQLLADGFEASMNAAGSWPDREIGTA